MKDFKKGLRLGIPIGLGYLSVSFAFGILAVSKGFEWWQAVIISMTTVTSAGQLAAVDIMMSPGRYIEMLLSQLTINVRYSFMSVSLSQKTAGEFRGIKKWLLGFFMTDEIFAVASTQKEVSSALFSGLAVMPYLGWTAGTLLGSIMGNVLPNNVMDALSLAIYGMFIAIVVPDAKKSVKLLSVVAVAIGLSLAFYYVPFLSSISSGISVCICAISAALFGALFFPIKEGDSDDR